jgi:hypothetical protein
VGEYAVAVMGRQFAVLNKAGERLEGECEHMDSIRDIVPINATSFLTLGDDKCVKYWQIEERVVCKETM